MLPEKIIFIIARVTMSWRSDAFDGAFDVEQDQDLEDFKETESPPVQKKMKKNASERCRQAEEKPRERHVLNKAEKKHMVTHIATIKDEIMISSLSDAAQQLSIINDSLKNFCDSIMPATLFFTRHLKKSFIRIYNECSTLKERYLQFQLKCMAQLLPYARILS